LSNRTISLSLIGKVDFGELVELFRTLAIFHVFDYVVNSRRVRLRPESGPCIGPRGFGRFGRLVNDYRTNFLRLWGTLDFSGLNQIFRDLLLRFDI
jgi:hypothetical protein